MDAMIDTFGREQLRRCVNVAVHALRRHQPAIDEANVYPIRDRDTGTNLLLTMTAVAGAVEDSLAQGDPFVAGPHAAVMGARGNSGVILAQLLRGLLAGGGGGVQEMAEA
ncbi:MAG: hypothetical protein NVSMB57_08850 [Actinomycetota bacterium]